MSPHSLANKAPPTGDGSFASLPASARTQDEPEYPTVQTFKAAGETAFADKTVDDVSAEMNQGDHITVSSSQGRSFAGAAVDEGDAKHTANHARQDGDQQLLICIDPQTLLDRDEQKFISGVGSGIGIMGGACALAILGVTFGPRAVASCRQSRQSAADSARSAGTNGIELQSGGGPQPSQSRGT